MSGAKSMNKHQREAFLRDYGFEKVDNGKGSHEHWEHAGLKALSETRRVKAPENLLSTPHQKPWELTLCNDPAKGTWHKLEKLARWSATIYDKISAEEEMLEDQRREKANLIENLRLQSEWRRAVRLSYKGSPHAPKALPLTPPRLKAVG